MNRFFRSRAFVILAAVLLQLTLWASAHAADVRVWVNTNSGVYHCPGAQYYGNTKHGEYLSESSAVARGYRAAYHRPCSSAVANKATQNLINTLAPSDAGNGIKVWINTGSHVYHCPGTRYYGATKRGRYASEAEAISSGNRPAYGQQCS